MANLVVGIFPQSDPKAIEGALGGQNIDLSKVKVITNNVDPASAEESVLEFVDVVVGMETNSFADGMTKRTGVLDETGTGVPGMGTSNPTVSDLASHGATGNYLASFAIPPDEVDNFNEAIDDGRAVVAYPDAADQASVAAAFKAAGLLNVRTY